MRRVAYPGKNLNVVIDAGKYGGIVGSDFAGVVEEIGPDVPKGVRSVGEKVAGFVTGGQYIIF